MTPKTARRIVSLLCAVLPLAAGGCAATVNGTRQQVRIVTIPPGATAEALGQSTVTPGALRLPRAAKQVVVHIEKDGYLPVDVLLRHERSGAVWGNLGLIPVGMVVGYRLANRHEWFGGFEEGLLGGVALPAAAMLHDFTSGAAYRFRDELLVGLEPRSAEQSPAAPGDRADASASRKEGSK